MPYKLTSEDVANVAEHFDQTSPAILILSSLLVPTMQVDSSRDTLLAMDTLLIMGSKTLEMHGPWEMQ